MKKNLGQYQFNYDNKRIALMGMSGVGKTTLSRLLPFDQWFHYSVDYRIGTRYLNEEINDFLKKEVMKNQVLADLLKSDSIVIYSNLSINDLKPLSVYLGMIGNAQENGLSLDLFLERLALHRQAEIRATRDTAFFIEKAQSLYGYPHFLCDTSGSLCEIDDPETWKDLASHCLLIYIKSTEDKEKELIERAIKNPKPLYYQKEFLLKAIQEYLGLNQLSSANEILPSEFVSWVFPRLFKHRLDLYQKVADDYGMTINMEETQTLKTEAQFIELIDNHLQNKK